MKNKHRKELKARLFAAIKKVLQQDDKADLTNRSEKAVRKSIKHIVKKTDNRKKGVSGKQMNRPVLNSQKIKMDSVTA